MGSTDETSALPLSGAAKLHVQSFEIVVVVGDEERSKDAG